MDAGHTNKKGSKTMKAATFKNCPFCNAGNTGVKRYQNEDGVEMISIGCIRGCVTIKRPLGREDELIKYWENRPEN
jgi:hypothetical protein